VTVDYAAGTTTLDDPKSFKYRGNGEVIALRVSGNRLFFEATVKPVGGNPVEAELVIDTGVTSTLTFHTPFVEKHNLRAVTPKLIPHTTVGLSGESRSWRGRLGGLQLGKLALDNPIATFSEAIKGSEADRSYDCALRGDLASFHGRLGLYTQTVDPRS
jgi:Aspartyl protease